MKQNFTKWTELLWHVTFQAVVRQKNAVYSSVNVFTRKYLLRALFLKSPTLRRDRHFYVLSAIHATEYLAACQVKACDQSGHSLRSGRLEVVGERENGRARGRHVRRVSFSRARFFLCPLLPSACYAGYIVTVYLNCIWHLIWRYLSKPVLGAHSVLSGHYSIAWGCPLNTGFPVFNFS